MLSATNSTPTPIYIYILIWLDNINDLQWLAKIKQERNIKILAVPTAYQIREYHPLRYQEIRQRYIDTIDIHLTASQFETDCQKEQINAAKLKIWWSGVALGKNNPILGNKKCICYVKAIPLDTALITEIEKLGIQCSVIHYYQNMNYNYFDWKEKLQDVDLVVILTDIQETQGIAYFEAWAENKPTIHPKGLCPYSSSETSLEYASMEELFEILKQYAHDPKKFLKQFNPYEAVKNSYTDEISVQNLLTIISELKKTK